MAVHTFNPSTWEVVAGGSLFKTSLVDFQASEDYIVRPVSKAKTKEKTFAGMAPANQGLKPCVQKKSTFSGRQQGLVLRGLRREEVVL